MRLDPLSHVNGVGDCLSPFSKSKASLVNEVKAFKTLHRAFTKKMKQEKCQIQDQVGTRIRTPPPFSPRLRSIFPLWGSVLTAYVPTWLWD